MDFIEALNMGNNIAFNSNGGSGDEAESNSNITYLIERTINASYPEDNITIWNESIRGDIKNFTNEFRNNLM